ncbi:MAG: hypothetical protein U0935_13520 [Pirellulales bacterium]
MSLPSTGPTTGLDRLRLAWQTDCAPLLNDMVQRWLAEQRAAVTATPVKVAPAGQPPAPRPLDITLRLWIEQTLVPFCARWLAARLADGKEASSLSAPVEPSHLRLRDLPPPPALRQADDEWSVPGSSWSLAAALGASAGMLAGAPLSLLVLGGRELGLFLGAIAGSAAAVAALAKLSQSPGLRRWVVIASTASAATATVRGCLGGGRSAWWRATFLAAGSTLLACLATPRPTRTRQIANLQEQELQLRRHLEHLADLILAWTWTSVATSPSGDAEVPVDESPRLGKLSLLGLAELHQERWLDRDRPDVLAGLIDEFFDLLRVDGLEFVAVSAGGYEPAWREQFHGLFTAGRRVRQRRPAALYRGRLVLKGELIADERSRTSDQHPSSVVTSPVTSAD